MDIGKSKSWKKTVAHIKWEGMMATKRSSNANTPSLPSLPHNEHALPSDRNRLGVSVSPPSDPVPALAFAISFANQIPVVHEVTGTRISRGFQCDEAVPWSNSTRDGRASFEPAVVGGGGRGVRWLRELAKE